MVASLITVQTMFMIMLLMLGQTTRQTLLQTITVGEEEIHVVEAMVMEEAVAFGPFT